MIYSVVWCAKASLRELIGEILFSDFGDDIRLDFPGSEDELTEILNFNMPDLLIVNFSESRFKSGKVSRSIMEDSWLHQFGTIGLYDRSEDREEEIFQEYTHFNILALIDVRRIKSWLAKSTRIIAENKQLVFQGIMAGNLVSQLSGSFMIENRDYILAPVYAALLSTCLAKMQKISMNRKRDIQIAVSEIIFNGIEHGNCGITFAEKSNWLGSGKSVYDLVLERNQLPGIACKKVMVEWEIGDDASKISIWDQGQGYDVKAYNQGAGDEAIEKFHGRGIMLTRSVVDRLIYNPRGNRATIIVEPQSGALVSIPAGFAREEVIKVGSGDVLMRTGEFADCLYYISSGVYTVYLKGRPVGTITNADIFMGEMAFLLNNARTATVVAEEAGRVIRIPRKSFLNTVKKYPQYAIFLSKILARKLARSNSLRVDGNASSEKFIQVC